MNTICQLSMGQTHIDVFCGGFFTGKNFVFAPLHNHRYAEIHILLEGCAEYTIDGKKYIYRAGDAILIPEKILHASHPTEENTRFISFMLNCGAKQHSHIHLSENVRVSICDAVNASSREKNIAPFYPYLYLLAINLGVLSKPEVKKNTDYPRLIFDYLDVHYNQDLTLADLSSTLGLSQKQTQRIIQKQTGNTFLQELTRRRMYTADYLIANTQMTISDIAQYVGYSSYSGYWKARKRFLEGK